MTQCGWRRKDAFAQISAIGSAFFQIETSSRSPVARNPFAPGSISGADTVSPRPKVQAFWGANLTRP